MQYNHTRAVAVAAAAMAASVHAFGQLADSWGYACATTKNPNTLGADAWDEAREHLEHAGYIHYDGYYLIATDRLRAVMDAVARRARQVR
jgi:hypothetical protein